MAVASSFLTTAEDIAIGFEDATGHTVLLTHASTGRLAAEIAEGAAFDVLLAADRLRPKQLAASGKALATATYATGSVILVSRVAVTPETAGEVMAGGTVALADPTAAPYGLAATRAMERLGLDTAAFRPVLVGNAEQVAAVFVGGTADFAFVAASQVPAIAAPHALPIDRIAVRQDAALLSDDEAARAFWDWLLSPDAKALIAAAGYTPG